jgi:hypothetical protein
MEWVLGVLAVAVLLAALYRFLPRVQGPRPSAHLARRCRPGPDRVGAAPETSVGDPFLAEVDRFLRAAARERPGSPPAAAPDAFAELVTLVRDRATATRLVAFHGSAEDAIEALVRDRRP